MHRNTKVATCCYCGARTALVLSKDRHELACANCGAPLHDMKMLRKDKKTDREVGREYIPEVHGPRSGYTQRPQRPKKQKKRKSTFKKIFEEAFDVIDDIFD